MKRLFFGPKKSFQQEVSKSQCLALMARWASNVHSVFCVINSLQRSMKHLLATLISKSQIDNSTYLRSMCFFFEPAL